MILVLPANYIQARQWASSQNLDPQEWRLLRDARDLLGRRDGRVMVLGGAEQRHDYRHIVELGRQRNMTFAYDDAA